MLDNDTAPHHADPRNDTELECTCKECGEFFYVDPLDYSEEPDVCLDCEEQAEAEDAS